MRDNGGTGIEPGLDDGIKTLSLAMMVRDEAAGAGPIREEMTA